MVLGKGKNRPQSWQDRTHLVEFESDEIVKIREAVKKDGRPLEQVFESLCVDNNALRVKSTEFYNCYTFSFTFDKHHPQWPGHSFWFYHGQVLEGCRVMSWYVEHYLKDLKPSDIGTSQHTLW